MKVGRISVRSVASISKFRERARTPGALNDEMGSRVAFFSIGGGCWLPGRADCLLGSVAPVYLPPGLWVFGLPTWLWR